MHRQTRRLIILSLGLCVLACTTGPRRRAPAVEATVTRVDVVDISYADVALLAQVDVHNSRRRPVTVSGYSWELALGKHPLVTGSTEDTIAIAPAETTSITVPMALHIGDQTIPHDASNALGVPYTLHVQFGADGPRATHDSTLRLPVAPEAHLAAVWVRQLSWHEATVQLDLNVTPRSGGRLELRALDCELWMEGRRIARFALEQANVPIATDVRLPLTQHVRLGAQGQPTAAILRRSEARYRLRGYAAFYAHGFGVLRLPIDDAGTITVQPPAA